jgi:hypothetical protein
MMNVNTARQTRVNSYERDCACVFWGSWDDDAVCGIHLFHKNSSSFTSSILTVSNHVLE